MERSTIDNVAIKKERDARAKLVEYNSNVVRTWLEKSGIPNAEMIRITPEYIKVGTRVYLKTRCFDICLIGSNIGSSRFKRELIFKPSLWTNAEYIDKNRVKDELDSFKLFTFFMEHMSDLEKDLIKTSKSKKLFKAWYATFQGLRYGS